MIWFTLDSRIYRMIEMENRLVIVRYRWCEDREQEGPQRRNLNKIIVVTEWFCVFIVVVFTHVIKWHRIVHTYLHQRKTERHFVPVCSHFSFPPTAQSNH
jgi:hypothetical protein